MNDSIEPLVDFPADLPTNGADSARKPRGPRGVDEVRFNHFPDANSHLDGHASGTGRGFDAWPLLEVLVQRWRWLACGGVVCAALGLALALLVWQTSYTAVAQLVRYDSPNAIEIFGHRQISPQTFAGMFRSPELLQRVGAKARPPLSAEALATRVRVMPERSSELVAVAVAANNPEEAVGLANLFAREAVLYTQEMQGKSAAEVNRFLSQQLTDIEVEIAALNRQWWSLPRADRLVPAGTNATALPPTGPRMPLARFSGRLEAARDELFDLLTRYTDAHPLVLAQRAKIAAIERQILEPGNPASEPVASEAPVASVAPSSKETSPPRTVAESDPEVIRSKLHLLETGRLTLTGRQRAAQSFAGNPPGYFRVLAEATTKEAVKLGRRMKVVFLTILFGVAGVLGAAGSILFTEFFDGRLKTATDVKRVTGLPLLGALGDLQRMKPEERRNWAFRTWTMLQRRMSLSPNHGLVCGVTSSREGEGRSTWVSLLAQAASERGFRVLTIGTRPSEAACAVNGGEPLAMPGKNGGEASMPAAETALLAANVLTTPAEVTQKLTGPNPQPLVHILLPGWVWNLERRKQWQAALNHWRQIDNIVILVELPPASVPEAVLLAENLPNLVWLADCGTAEAGETRTQVDTLRNARCHLVGAVMNHGPSARLRNRLPRWLEMECPT